MAHNYIVGMTGSGKSSLAKAICREVKVSGIPTVVLDPLQDDGWDTDHQFTDPQAFLAFVRQSKSCVLFVDEGGQSIGRYNEEMQWLATTSRHWGHSCWFISQGLTQVAPIVRQQSNKFYIFACGLANLDLVAEECREPDLKRFDKIGQGEFLIVSRFDAMLHGSVKWIDGRPVVEYDYLKSGDPQGDE